jgi:hypothetical protein
VALVEDVRALPREMQIAAAASVALGLSMLLPWWERTFVIGGRVIQETVSAFGDFSFVEAAVLLVSLAVLFLVWARAKGKAFHLPGGDGVAIMLAGGWVGLLIVWRMFDTPNGPSGQPPPGLQWGIFVSLLAAGALAAAGARVRAAHRPEPPNPAAEQDDWIVPPRRERRPGRAPSDHTAVTEALRERPGWEGEPPEAPG